ncbi:MAG TPA: class I SAM-dependent rRNA methyltransferase [Chthoniobacteraceae bacterium]|nr:class I SAM-dependent rRNA methyltransferase [Chthoniobacteraceae bacterium]
MFHGHDWVYFSEVQKSFGGPVDGEVVSLKDGKDRLLGSAIYNSRSQIVARRFSRQKQALDADFFHRRIAQAIEYRQRRGVEMKRCRLVWSESDGLPGVIVDRYGEVLVLQTLTLAMDRRKGLIVEALRALLEPGAIVERNDAPIRKAEGLEPVVGMLYGEAPAQVAVEIEGLQFSIDPLHGQKTGFYLDQVGSYGAVAKWAGGRRVLDAFSNQGAFALACAKAGAASVDAVEISEEACARIERGAARNALEVKVHAANVFDFLKEAESREAQYDLVILDPPSFTRSKEKLRDAARGYKEIHLRALKLLSPGGLLATFSCSHHVDDALFREIISQAAVDARRTLRLLERFGQAIDHPVMLNLPETEYLRGFLFELAPGR